MSATSHNDAASDINDYHIEIGLDWGTFKWVAAFAVASGGKHVFQPCPLIISNDSHEVRMMATWDTAGRFIQGHELQGLANKDRIVADKIIDHFKLGLHDGPEVSSINARNASILADIPGKNYELLIIEHLKAVIEDIKKSIRMSELRASFTKQQIDNMLSRLLVRITVPQVWGPNARRSMQAAATKAGLLVVVLATEPLCALAYLVNRTSNRILKFGRTLERGSVIAVMDVGSGTGDFASFRLLAQLSPSSRLDPIEYSSGGLCGSYQVDLHLYAQLKKRKRRDWVVNSISALQVTERDFDRRALIAIEEVKQGFKETDDVCFGLIKGIGRAAIQISFTSAEILQALDSVIAPILSAMDVVVSKQEPDMIQVTGGFAKSWYLMSKLCERYSSERTVVIRPNDTDTAPCYPVAVGSLQRYDTISMQSLPSQFGYALLQREEFSKDTHKDSCTLSKDGRKASKKPWVLDSPYKKSVRVVDDRILNIVPKGTVLKLGQRATFNGALIYFVSVDDPRISAEFVYTDRKFQDNAASRNHEEELRRLPPGQEQVTDRIFRDGVHHWVKLDLPIPKAKLKGLKIIKFGQGEECYELEARVVIRLVSQDMQIEFEILNTSKAFKGTVMEADHDRMDVGGEDDVAFRLRDMVWDSAHSDFTQS